MREAQQKSLFKQVLQACREMYSGLLAHALDTVRLASPQAREFLGRLVSPNFEAPANFLFPGERALVTAGQGKARKTLLLNFLLQKVLIQAVLCSARNFD